MSGTLSSAGVGSGLDIASLVNQLVAAERAPTAQRLARQESTARVEISAYGLLRSALADLQSSLTGATGDAQTEGRTASASREDLLEVSAASGAALGRFDIVVERLASSGRAATLTPRDPAADVGAGTLSLTLGSDSFDVATTAGMDLAALRDAINDAADNPGINATIINVDGGSVLSLGSDISGLNSAISASGSGDIATLAADIGETRPAQDALLQIDGLPRSSAENSISDAIDGVTLNLLAADVGATTTITIGRDDGALQQGLEDFVEAWNSFASNADTLGAYNASTGDAGALNGDALLRGIENQLRQIVSAGQGTDDLLRGAEFGLRFDTQGKLELDSAALAESLSTRRDDVAAWWNGPDGLASALDGVLSQQLGDDASLKSREDALSARLERIDQREERLDLRMESVRARYLAQFTALDVALAQLQTTSSFLSQQLAGLNSGST